MAERPTGSRHAPVSRPSWPSSLEPHVYTVPSAASATVCMPPQATCSTCAKPRDRVGGRERCERKRSEFFQVRLRRPPAVPGCRALAQPVSRRRALQRWTCILANLKASPAALPRPPHPALGPAPPRPAPLPRPTSLPSTFSSSGRRALISFPFSLFPSPSSPNWPRPTTNTSPGTCVHARTGRAGGWALSGGAGRRAGVFPAAPRQPQRYRQSPQRISCCLAHPPWHVMGGSRAAAPPPPPPCAGPSGSGTRHPPPPCASPGPAPGWPAAC